MENRVNSRQPKLIRADFLWPDLRAWFSRRFPLSWSITLIHGWAFAVDRRVLSRR